MNLSNVALVTMCDPYCLVFWQWDRVLTKAVHHKINSLLTFAKWKKIPAYYMYICRDCVSVFIGRKQYISNIEHICITFIIPSNCNYWTMFDLSRVILRLHWSYCPWNQYNFGQRSKRYDYSLIKIVTFNKIRQHWIELENKKTQWSWNTICINEAQSKESFANFHTLSAYRLVKFCSINT